MMRNVSKATPTMMRRDVPPKNEAIAHGIDIQPMSSIGISATISRPVPPISVLGAISPPPYSYCQAIAPLTVGVVSCANSASPRAM